MARLSSLFLAIDLPEKAAKILEDARLEGRITLRQHDAMAWFVSRVAVLAATKKKTPAPRVAFNAVRPVLHRLPGCKPGGSLGGVPWFKDLGESLGLWKRCHDYSNAPTAGRSEALSLTEGIFQRPSVSVAITDRLVAKRIERRGLAIERHRAELVSNDPLLRYVDDCCKELRINQSAALSIVQARGGSPGEIRTVAKIAAGQAQVSKPSRSLRVTPTHLTLPGSVVLGNLFLRGSKAVSIDLDAAHPALCFPQLLERVKAPLDVQQEYEAFLSNGNPYDTIAQELGLNRPTVKRAFLHVLNRPSWQAWSFHQELEKIIPKTCAWLKRKKKWKGHHSPLGPMISRLLMTLEQYTMREFYNILIEKKIPFIPEHDGLLVRIEDAKVVQQMLSAHVNGKTGVKIKLP